MALSSLNRVFLSGYLVSDPVFLNDGLHDHDLEITLNIYNPSNPERSRNVSFLIESDRQILMEKALRTCKTGQYLQMEGRLVTKDLEDIQRYVCPQCGHVDWGSAHIEVTEIVCSSFEVFALSASEAKKQGQNQVFLLGNICSDLAYWENEETGRKYLKYKLGVDQNLFPDRISNFPFILHSGYEAGYLQETVNIQTGALMLIEGRVNQRKIEVPIGFTCQNPGCQTDYIQQHPRVIREVYALNSQALTRGQPGDYPMQESVRLMPDAQ